MSSRIFLFTLSQWLFWPSGSRVARKGWRLMMPSTVVIPRVGSFALASLGSKRKLHEPDFGGSAGRKSLALKRIFGLDLRIYKRPLLTPPSVSEIMPDREITLDEQPWPYRSGSQHSGKTPGTKFQGGSSATWADLRVATSDGFAASTRRWPPRFRCTYTW